MFSFKMFHNHVFGKSRLTFTVVVLSCPFDVFYAQSFFFFCSRVSYAEHFKVMATGSTTWLLTLIMHCELGHSTLQTGALLGMVQVRSLTVSVLNLCMCEVVLVLDNAFQT